MAKDWWKWCLALAGGLAAGVVVTAVWMDARAWRAETERRLDGLEIAGTVAPELEGEAARIIAQAKERLLEVAGPGGAGPRGCEGTGASAGVARTTDPGGVGVSAEEWLARQEAS